MFKCIVENRNGAFLAVAHLPSEGDLLTDSAEVIRQGGGEIVTRHEEPRYGTNHRYIGADIVESVFDATRERILQEVVSDADEDE